MTGGFLTLSEVKPGNEAEVERIIKEALSSVQEELATSAWFGFRLGPATFGIFGVFPNEEDLQERLSHEVLDRIDKANEFLTQPRITENVDVLAARLPKKGGDRLVTVGQLVRYETKPGNEVEAERIIKESLSVIEQEPRTTVWFGLRLGPSSFGSFDAFPDEEGRLVHLSAGMSRVREGAINLIIQQTLVIEKVDMFVARFP